MHTPLQFGARHKSDAPLFQNARAARTLRVLVDAPIWARLQRSRTVPGVLLRELLGDDRISMSLYGDNGPPPDVRRHPMDSIWGGGEAIGWTVVTPTDDAMVSHDWTAATNKSVTSGALLRDQVWIAEMRLRREHGAVAARDALLLAVTQATEPDLLITEREALLTAGLAETENCQVARPDDALALVALYLRSAGEFIVFKGPGITYAANSAEFYDLVADVLIPSLGEVVRRADGRIAFQRLNTVVIRARALLAARDRLVLLTSESVTPDVADEVSQTFTHALVEMVAIHDVLARIANEFLDPPTGNPRQVKWQESAWRRRVTERFPDLADAWADGGYAKHLNDALRAIRNEIHDVAPVMTPYRSQNGTAQIGLSFRADIGTRVVASLAALADDGGHGVHRAFSDGHLVEPLQFYEYVLPWLLRTVEQILCALLAELPDTAASQVSRTFIRPEVKAESLMAIARLRILAAR